MNKSKEHWENVYSTKADEQLSWTQPTPGISLQWILESSPARDAKVIDIGAGISELTDRLLAENFKQPAVLDISGAALERAKKRLGAKASLVQWIESDITAFAPTEKFSFWHDRAVFHFLAKPEDRDKYVATLTQTLIPGGFALIATFATDGPSKCSGLEVMRYDERTLTQELGSAFHLIKSQRYTHTTPWGSQQNFVFCLFKKT
ncbi:class I SAM-dependent methyltransferase [Bdellovibrio sp. HCB2-146]|uniref:class I SAM-dependent methyltransferase n=1 Tax=Bdellovibrio sp. HCB2-146 TaxID=3394362 RepID=UPI0039BC3FE8